MKAKDLMLFDLVKRRKDSKIMTVVELRYAETVAAITPDDVYYGDMEDYHESEIEPIPLTPEILEKNGFEYNDEDAEYAGCTWSDGNIMLHLEYDFRIVVTNDFDDESTNRTPFVLRYVHQLQHVYKLLGIDKEITVC